MLFPGFRRLFSQGANAACRLPTFTKRKVDNNVIGSIPDSESQNGNGLLETISEELDLILGRMPQSDAAGFYPQKRDG